ncbi:fatty acid synthase [Brachionus plicatilis]|uniref:Fatty acid synthase n=1 Tax=Brachionus plicatilis TaxID=10195 RepID=A0A3M7QDU1_BRAPC|nr:fatty acid synthase [Brachionus plicatilis]
MTGPNAEVEPDQIVISGISGRYPQSSNIDEFAKNLFDGVDMVTETDRRWPPGLYGLPRRNGTLKDISKFDAQFFGVNPKQADQMDPQLRMLLEVAYEAIFDSGISPSELAGTRTGVYIGLSSSEALYAYSHNPSELSGYSMTGCASSMLANRLSFFFDFKGPSYTVDTACSSSLVALDAAVQSIKSGYCDYAIVGGANLLTRPQTSLQFQRLGMLSPDGMCRSFDSSGKGYVRSETVSVVFIQKKSTCRKYYARIINSRVNTDGAKEQGITFPNGQVQARLLEELYTQSRIDPRMVSYVEAHGTGTKAGDPQELNAIADIFSKNRANPLLIGSTKSNMGHPEPASGLAALSKILISIQSGIIPANLHFKEPNGQIEALLDGRLRVVDKNMKLSEGLIGLNSFGFGGANAHLLIEPNWDKETNLWSEKSYVNEVSKKVRLFQFSSRTEQGLNEILDLVEQSDDLALSCILEPLSLQSTHAFRAFTILNGKSQIREFNHEHKEKRPVWYVFSGMGTQWTGMGRDLMQIETFRQSIQKSALILKPFELDLVQIINHADSDTFKRTLNSFVAIASIQIALVDCLNQLEVRPDGILGHSVGELGCAYADGCLTHEETLLAAFYRGKCIEEASLPPGAMAAVGLTWAECKKRCPQGVVAACHNAPDTVTVSGPKELVAQFVQQLKSEGVFARDVDSSNVAFHSHYMCQIAAKLKDYLNQVIKEPRLRSNKWISSSIEEKNWHSELCKYSSADYHVNNLCSAVLFQEALSHVPANAITIEIAPHALLQAILKRSLTKDNIFIGLLNKNASNQIENFYAQLGRLYLNGVDFKPTRLLIDTKWQHALYPIPVKTKFLSPLMKWDHGHSWNVPKYTDFTSQANGSTSSTEAANFSYVIDLEGDNAYLSGHQIDGRVLYPATGYLCLVWQSVAKMAQSKRLGMIDDTNLVLPAIEFQNVEIHRASILKEGEKINFEVNLMATSGSFELTEGGNLVVSGQVRLLEEKMDPDQASQMNTLDALSRIKRTESMLKEEVYKELRLRGYEYKDQFQPIEKCDLNGTMGLLKWTGNWVPFLDAMLQMNVLGHQRGLLLPTRIRTIQIDPAQHLSLVEDCSLPVMFDPYTKTTISGAAQIIGLHATVAPKRQVFQPTIIEHVKFVAYLDDVNNNMVQLSQQEQTKQDQVKEYIQKCCSTVSEQSHASASLIQFLASQSNNGAQFLSAFSQDKILNLNSDRVNNFKAMVDIFVENLHPRPKKEKIRLLEICSSMCYSMCSTLTNLLRSHPHICDQIEIGYAQIESVSDLEAQFFDQISSDSLFKVEKIDWKIGQDNSLNTHVPSTIGQFDLVILNNSNLSKYENVRSWLHNNLAKLTHSFVLVVEDFVHEKAFKQLIANLEHSVLKKDISVPSPFDLELMQTLGLTKLSERCAFSEQSLWRFGKKYQNNCFVNTDNLAELNWLDEIKTSLSDPTIDRVFLLSQCETSGLVGLVNCLRKESNGHKIRCVVGKRLDQVPQSVLDKDLVMNVYRNDEWGSLRHAVTDAHNLLVNSDKDLFKDQFSRDEHNMCVNWLQRGDLASLRWIQSAQAVATHAHHVICQVAYAALNFRDIMLATGKLSPEAIPNYHKMQDNLLGMEFSGHADGQKCMGIVSARGLSTQVVLDKSYVWQVPHEWSLWDAATVPVAYSTAYYALCVRANLKRGESVLVHAGSGAVGQAAISIALSFDCQVFTTVSSEQKREYLRCRFNDRLFFANSRDLSFENDVLRETQGRGVNIVLNSLSEQKLQASVRVLAEHGRFLEIGKFDLNKNSSLGMSVFLKNISFHGILLDSLFDKSNEHEWKTVHDLVQNGIETGVVKPLNATIFAKDQIEQAFRFMAQGKHIGKVLVSCAATAARVEALAKVWFAPDHSYIITGGLGGFGLELAEWLVERGARNLILTSRSGIRTGYQTRKLNMFKQEYNANVQVISYDVKILSQCKLLIQKATEMSKSGKIGGIFHLAALLQDALLENQSVTKFKTVIDIKYEGALNLDTLTRSSELMEDTAYFVVFSSVTSGRGNIGQSNYGFANSAMERICERRKMEGKNALAIQWGAIGDVGLVVESHMNGSNETVVGGTLPQRVYGCLRTLEHLLLISNAEQCATWSSFVPAFSGADKHSQKPDTDKSLVQTVANIMGIKDLRQIRNEKQSLAEMGLDSLMSVEIKQILEQGYNINLSMKEIQALSLEKLKEMQHVAPAEAKVATEQNFSVKETKMLMPSQMIVKLNEQVDDEKCVFVIHPIEGHVQMLTEFGHKMKCSVYGIQFTKEAVETTSLPQLAQLYWKEIEKVKGADTKINLCGYSFGASVAFEMALQKTNRVRTLTLLDGSHSYVNVQVNAYKTKLQLDNSAETESEALFTFYQQFGQVESRTEFIKNLSCMKTFESRVKFVVDGLMQNCSYKFDAADAEMAARAFVLKLMMSFGYQPKEKLRMERILLIKSQSQTNLISNIQAVLGADYGLSKVFEGRVDVKSVGGDHQTFLQGDNLSEVVQLVESSFC